MSIKILNLKSAKTYESLYWYHVKQFILASSFNFHILFKCYVLYCPL